MNKYYDFEQQRIKKTGYKNVFKGMNKIIYSTFLLSIAIILLYVSFKNDTTFDNILTKIILLFVLIPILISTFFVSFSNSEKEDNTNVALVNEREKKNYFLKIGSEVKKHYGDISLTSKIKNIVQDLLIKEKDYCTHWIVMGTTGSGKTVFVQTIIKQILKFGGGYIFVDGKGTQKMLKTFKAIAWLFNRQRDFHILNFANPEKSNSINIFQMSKNQLIEIFNLMLVSGKDAYWEGKATTLSSNLLHFIVPLQSLGIAINAKEVNNINTYEELKIKSYKTMNFTILNEYLEAKTLIDIVKMFKRIYKNSPEFENIFIKASKQDTLDFQENAENGLLSWLSQQSNLEMNYLLETDYKQIIKDNDDPFYMIGSAFTYFSPIMTMFTKEYGNIFNKNDYDLNIEDIILNHRLLYIALPGTKSNTTKSMLARFIQANLVATYETLKDSRPLNKPFTVFWDEINSYMVGIEGVGNLPSQTREQKLAFFYMFQTDLGKMDDGKGLEKEQIFGNVNNYVILKLKSPELTKMLQERFPKKKVIVKKETDFYEGIKEGEKDTLDLIEKPYFEAEDLERLSNGECYIKIADKCYEGIGGYMEEPNYYQDEPQEQIQLIVKKSKTQEMII